MKLRNPFKKLQKFIKNKKEAKELIRINAKKKELEQYADLLTKLIRPNGLSLPSDASIGEYDSEEKGADTPVYFYDFLKEWNNNGNFAMGGSSVVSGYVAIDSSNDSDGVNPAPPVIGIGISGGIEEAKPKVIVKPKDVFHELEKMPDAVSLTNLDEKIVTFKMRQKFIRYNNYAKKEVIDMVLRLENRKKYDQYKDFFEKFDYTTTEKINALISKYDLVLKSTDLFIPTLPSEAIVVMDNYENKVVELCNKKPVFYLIAENEKFKKEFDRNDPILLVQSPFGIYWQILGAWDKEVLLLEEL